MPNHNKPTDNKTNTSTKNRMGGSIKNRLLVLKGLGLKKIALIVVVILVCASMIPWVIEGYSTPAVNDNKWVQVGAKVTVENVILSEYAAFVEKNLAYIQQNPFVLANFLNNLISKHISVLLFANEAENIDLAVDEGTLLSLISNIPAFKNEDGTFNRQEFTNRISGIFGSEKVFLDNIRYSMLRDQLIEALYPVIIQPYYIGYLDFLSVSQERTITYIDFTPSLVNKTIAKPTKQDLLNLRDKYKEIFSNPETRDFELITLDLNQLVNDIKISDKEINEHYEKNKNNYLTTELRDISQINFATKEEAAAAYKTLKDLDLAAAEKAYSMVSLGEIKHEDLPVAIANPIFRAPVGKFSQPIESAAGWQIFIVNKIESPRHEKLEQIKDKIKEEIKIVKSNSLLEDTRRQFLSSLEQKPKLKEVSSQLKGKYQNFKNTTEEQLAKSLNNNEAIIQNIFQSSVQNTPSLLEDKEGNFYTFMITKIEPSKIKELNLVQKELTEIWNKEQISVKISEAVASTILSLSSGGDISKLGYKVENATLSRSSKEIPFEQENLESLFLSEKDKVVEGMLSNGNRFVGVIKDIKNKEISLTNQDGARDQAVVNFTDYMNQTYIQTMLEQYSSNLEGKYKIFINEEAILNKLAPAQMNQQ
ncbi:putative peptidyl-prolyl cis-trans isomerase [Candidatus Hepatincolaceae symbiont of Richtersius coronifer]